MIVNVVLLLATAWSEQSVTYPASDRQLQEKDYHEIKVYSKYIDRKDYFGHSVAIHKDLVVAGAYSSSAFQIDSGAAFSFFRNASYKWTTRNNETLWTEMGYLIGSDMKPHDYFGGCIAVWNYVAIVGAYLNENIGTHSGSAYIFLSNRGSWYEQQKLTSPDGTSADFFGESVDIFEDTAIVGAYGQAVRGYFRGCAYIFSKGEYYWTQTAMLRPSDVRDNHMFGYSVKLWNDTVIVGAYGDDLQGSNTGAIYIFQNLSPQRGWDGAWVQTQKLTASDGRQHSNFGISLDISQELLTNKQGVFFSVVVGANLGQGLSSSTGAAYLFRSTATTHGSLFQWSQQSKLTAPDGIGEERFGTSVAIDGDLIVIGAPEDSSAGTDAGSVYVYHRGKSTTGDGHKMQWSFDKKIIGNDTGAYDHFGISVALWEDVMVIGSDHASGNTPSSGAIYIIINGESPPQTERKPSVLATEKDKFVFILSLLPMLLVLLPLCVVSSVVSFSRHLTSLKNAIGGVRRRTSVPLEDYASLHGSTVHNPTADESGHLKGLASSKVDEVTSVSSFPSLLHSSSFLRHACVCDVM
jgi:hypothetical protein